MTDDTRAAVVQRVVPAAPEEVYDEWLDAEAVADWMCPFPIRAIRVELDPRLGGRLRIDMDENGYAFTVTGTYLELERPHRLRFSWSSTGWQPSDPNSIVTVTFEPHGDAQTLMTIRHDQLPPTRVDRHRTLWDAVARQLDTRLEGRRQTTTGEQP